jgi:hypothetical protein
LGNRRVKFLLSAVYTAGQKSTSEYKEKITENTTNERGLHNHHFVLDKSQDGDDELNCIAKGRLETVLASDHGARTI